MRAGYGNASGYSCHKITHKTLQAPWEDLNTKHDAAVKVLQETQDDEEMDSAEPLKTATNSQPIISHAGGNTIPPDTHETIDEDDEIT